MTAAGWRRRSSSCPTPRSVVSEGIAEIGLDLLLDGELEGEIGDVLAAHGLEDDLDLALEVDRARRPTRGLGLDAALIVHERGGTVAEAQAYVERWGLRTPEQAAQTVRFVTDPTWRAYVVTYSAGQELCGAYVGGDPGPVPHAADRAGARRRPDRAQPSGQAAEPSGCGRRQAEPGIRDARDVTVVGAAAAAEHGQVRQALADREVVGRRARPGRRRRAPRTRRARHGSSSRRSRGSRECDPTARARRAPTGSGSGWAQLTMK